MNTSNNEINRILDYLNVYLDLKRNPVGIKFISDNNVKKSKFKQYDKKIPYCTVVRNCTLDNSYLLDVDNFSCMAAATFLGLSKPLDEFLSGERYIRLKVYQDLDISKKIVKTMSIMKQETIKVEVATLNKFDESPDVVIIICNAYNAMRVIQAYSYSNGYTTHNRMLGMCALCHECTSYPFISNEMNISMMCSGTRCVAQWNDDEMGIGVPFHQLFNILEGLKITSNLMDPNSKKSKTEKKLNESIYLQNEKVIYGKNYYTNSYLKNENIKK